MREIPTDKRIEALLDEAAEGLGGFDVECTEARALTEILQEQHRGVVKKDMQTLGEAAECASLSQVQATRAILRATDAEEVVEGSLEKELPNPNPNWRS